MDRRGAFLGPVLIVVGLLLLLGQMGIPAFSSLWPLFLIVPGAAMLLRWFTSRGDSGLVFSGTLLVLLGGFFQLDQWFWFHMGDHWPFFPLAVGIALTARAIVDRESRDAFIPGGILIGVGVVFYFFSSGAFSWLVNFFVDLIMLVVRVALPLGLIAWGAWLLFGKKKGLGGDDDFPEKIEPQSPGGPEPAMAGGPGPAPPSTVDDAVITPPVPTADDTIEDAEFEDDSPEPPARG